VICVCNRRLSTTAIRCLTVWLLVWGVLVGRNDAARAEHGRLGSSEKLTKAATISQTSTCVYNSAFAAHYMSIYLQLYVYQSNLCTSRNAHVCSAPPI
jgi:hypothetical protein